MKKKSEKVEQNIYKLENSNSMYYVRVTKLIGGDRKERYATVKGKGEARKLRQEFIKELEREKEEAESGLITIEKLFEVWIKSNRKLSLGTIGTYKNQQSRVNKTVIKHKRGKKDKKIEIGKMYVNELKREHFIEFKEALQGENLSVTYTNSLLKQLFTLYEYAHLKGYVKAMDFHSLKGVREKAYRDDAVEDIKDGDDYTFTKEEIDKIMKAVEGTKYYLVVLLGLSTGMRISEILGLRWCRVDLENGFMKIDKQLQYYTGKEVDNTPGYYWVNVKTKKSIRTVKMQDYLVEELKKAEIEVKNVMNRVYTRDKYIIKEMDIDDFVCVDEEGNHLKKSAPQDIEEYILNETGIKFKSHDMRKYHTTHLFYEGISIKGISKRLGHKDIAVTLKMYLKNSKENEEKTEEEIKNLEFTLPFTP